MLSYSEYAIVENYKNFIGPKSVDKRRKWADQVWDILNSSYAPIGGIKGKGFTTKEDMIEKIPFWKIYTKNDKVIVAVFYKDKNGRKAVAIATDGSELGAKIVDDVYKASLGVSYGEKSGRALGKMMKAVSWDILKDFLLKPEEITKLTKDKTIPVEKYDIENLNPNDKFTYDKYPHLRPWMYVRDLGGEIRLKVSIGTPNLPILKNG